MPYVCYTTTMKDRVVAKPQEIEVKPPVVAKPEVIAPDAEMAAATAEMVEKNLTFIP